MDLDSEITARFVCPKCGKHGASVKRFAATGTGLSKLLDLQHNTFLAASCTNCGFTEIYNPEIIEGKSNLGNVLDLFFG